MATADDRLLRLIGRMYDAAIERDSWDAVVAAVAEEFHSAAANLMAEDLGARSLTRFASVVGASETAMREFQEYYVRHDVLAAAGARNGPGVIGTDESLLPREVYRRSELFNDYMVPHGYGHTMGAVLATDGMTAMMFGLQRSLTIGPYTEQEVERLSVLLPHMERAWATQVRIGSAVAAAADDEAVLEQLPFGTITLDSRAGVLRVTGLARELSARRDALIVDGAELRAMVTAENQRLRELIGKACRIGLDPRLDGRASMALTRRDGSRVLVTVAPLPPRTTHARAAAIVFVHDPRRPLPDLETTLKQTYGLTGAEARLCLAIARGETLREISEKTHVTVHTLRSQLKSAMGKTETRRQSELVSLLLRGVLNVPV